MEFSAGTSDNDMADIMFASGLDSAVCVKALQGMPEVACEKLEGVDETKPKKVDKRAHAEPTPPPRLQVLLHHLKDGKTKF